MPDTVAQPRGGGAVELALVAGATAVVRRLAHSPLKLLTPGGAGRCARVVTSTYGGGLLAGDEIALRVTAGEDTRCAIGTQASTKIYRGNGRPSRQSLDASVGAGASLAVVPDPVTCFAGASYSQRQTFRLDPTASLLLVDWLTSGRAACGERWAFTRYRSDTRIDVGPAGVARDAVSLQSAEGELTVSERMGRFDCIATVFLLGPAFAPAAAGLLEQVERMRVGHRAPLVASASPLKDGALLRIAGGAAESVGRFIAGLLEPAWPALGEDPWSRKW